MHSILILADIEGSTGCRSRADSQLFNDGWVNACVQMTQDLNAVISALKTHNSVGRIRVKDFHRTGFNIFADLLDKRAELSQGYDSDPVIGIGDCRGFDLLFMVGLHAASGTEGFLPHTLTSKFEAIKFHHRPVTEAELFSASVASSGIKPVFFSGCPQACIQAKAAIPWLKTVEIDKNEPANPEKQRQKLAQKALEAIRCAHTEAKVFDCKGSGQLEITLREDVAKKIARRWKLELIQNQAVFSVENLNDAYQRLIELAYLTPFWAKNLAWGLRFFNLWGRLCHFWALKRRGSLQSAFVIDEVDADRGCERNQRH